MFCSEAIEKYPLTCYQMDIWLEQIMYPDDPFYNVGAYFTIEGSFDFSVFQEAVKLLVRENDSLSIRLEEDGIEIYQVFDSDFNSNVDYYDFTEETDPIDFSIKWMESEFLKPFEIESDALFKNCIIKAAEDIHFWFTKAHHLVTDGMGYSLIDERVVENYNMLIKGQALENRQIYSYKDFVQKDLEYLNSDKYKDDGYFWEEFIKNSPEAFLQAQNNKNIKITGKSSLKTLVLERDFYDEILALCEESNCTIFHFLVGTLFIAISKLYSKESMCIGIALFNRRNKKFKKTIGHFVNIVPLILNYEEEYSIKEFFTDIRKKLFKCYRHIHYPLSEIIKKTDAKSKGKLFDLTFSYETSNHTWEFLNAKKSLRRLYHDTEKNAMDICVKEYSDKEDVEIDFNYQVDLFNEDNINTIASTIYSVMKLAVNNPSIKLSKVNLEEMEG